MNPRNEREAYGLLGTANDLEIERWIAAAEGRKPRAKPPGGCLLVSAALIVTALITIALLVWPG